MVNGLQIFCASYGERISHLSKHVGAACNGELQNCKRQFGTPHNPSVITVEKRGTIVGHIPKIFTESFCAVK